MQGARVSRVCVCVRRALAIFKRFLALGLRSVTFLKNTHTSRKQLSYWPLAERETKKWSAVDRQTFCVCLFCGFEAHHCKAFFAL